MDVYAIMMLLAQKYPVAMLVFVALGALVVVGQAVVALTPSKKDDEMLEEIQKSSIGSAIMKALMAFAPIQKK